MTIVTKHACAAQLIYWLRAEVGDKAISGRALADILAAILDAQDEDRAALVDEVIDAAGQVIKTSTAELSDRLDRIDGAVLLKSAGAAVVSANLRALDAVAADVELRRAKLISGTPSGFLEAVLDEGQAPASKSADAIRRKVTVSP
ncbi:hypothetical protein ACEUZ9_002687 [Paracoccus litorisediminis]|uniref:hypothetical protein n=1 Tax=Paracoccus litorisediminis TaxID=2006130 RepID=UPI00372FF1B7